MKDKIERLSQLWVTWNAKEITGNDFAMAFREEFHYETSQAWNKRMLPRKIIHEIHRKHFAEKIIKKLEEK
jgi:hypothetical protein